MKKYSEKTNHCVYCGRTLIANSFYNSNSLLAVNNGNKSWICKKCTESIYTDLIRTYKDEYYCLYKICQLLDMYFEESLATNCIEQAREQEKSVIKVYIVKVNSLSQYAGKTFTDIQIAEEPSMPKVNFVDVELTDEDLHNREEMFSLIHYDPFKDEPPKDRPYLYNTVLNYLNSNTLKDSFKLSTIIEITKMFCQLNNVNDVINTLLNDTSNLEQQSAKVKVFMDIKKSLNAQIINFAKQNGIASSKDSLTNGGDTLSGIIKDLKNKKINLSDTNYMDIKSQEAYRQICDISMKSILEQSLFDENDYIDMIKESRKYIDEIDQKNTKLEKDNYNLKLKNHFLMEEMEKRGFEVEFE